MITIDSSGASANVSDEVFLPPVLQDRKSRAYGSLGSTVSAAVDGGAVSFAAAAAKSPTAGQHTTAEVNVVTDGTNSEQTLQVSTPSSTLTKLAKGACPFLYDVYLLLQAPFLHILSKLSYHTTIKL